MRPFLLTPALLLLAATLITGCGSQRAADTVDSPPTDGPQFSAKKGLLLPEQTRRALGLKLVEVKERKISSTVEMDLRVYRKDATVAYATAMVEPAQAQLLQIGQALNLAAVGDRAQMGYVTSVQNDSQHNSGFSEVLVQISGDIASSLAEGKFLKAMATLESHAEVLTIPRTALLACSEGQFVYTVSGDHLVRTAVKVGARSAEDVEVIDGLYAGDEVVENPVLSLWMTELAAVKGGQACCIEPPKGK
jgi:hypothetical protein